MNDRHPAIAVPSVNSGAQALCGQTHEAVDIAGTAQHRYGFAPFGKHVVRGQTALGEDRARHPVAGRAPCVVHFGLGLGEFEGHLVGPGMSAAVKQDGLHDGVDHLVVIRGQGYGDAEFLADLFGLAKDHAEDSAVDGIVLAVDHERANGAGSLAETVGSALTLFVAGRIPGEVVVDHGVEVVLEVDTFGQAVGGNQDGPNLLVEFAERLDPLFALIGSELPGDHGDMGISGTQRLLQFVAYIVRGGDVAAEDDGPETVEHEPADLVDQRRELGIVPRTAQRIRPVDELAQGLGILGLDGAGGNALGEGE